MDITLSPDHRAIEENVGRIVARFGDDEEWRTNVMKREARKHPEDCPPGKFLHPHDACFDKDGNIFIAEWVATGRITKLRKLS